MITLELLNIADVGQCYIVVEELSYILASPVVLGHWCIVVWEHRYIAVVVHLYIALEVRLNIVALEYFGIAALGPVLEPVKEFIIELSIICCLLYYCYIFLKELIDR